MSPLPLLALATALLLGACAPGQPPDPCAVERIARVPLDMAEGLPRVTVAINGRPATMLLDTGANAVILTPAAARRLGVEEQSQEMLAATAVGGATYGRAVNLATLSFAGTEINDQRAAEMALPMDRFGGELLDGILGTPVLNRFDLELDSEAASLTLYRARACPGGAIPWPRPYAMLPMLSRARIAHITVPVRINGMPAAGLIDTGATHTMVDLALARRLGVPEAALAPAASLETQGLGPAAGRYWRHRFARIELGGRAYTNVELAITDLGNEAEMLVGQDFLFGRRIWLSRESDTVYISDPREGRPK